MKFECWPFHGKMGALHCAAAATSSLHPRNRRLTSETVYPRRPTLLITCFSPSFPAKSTRRKNHLRQKILKTLENPVIPKLPPENPVISIDSPPFQEIIESGIIQEIQESDKSENSEAGNEGAQTFEELREIEVSLPEGGSVNGNIGVLNKNTILKYGLWLAGAFVFQTVCAVFVFGSAGPDDKNAILPVNEGSSVLEVGGDGKGKSRVKIVLNGNGNGNMGVENNAVDSIVYVDELEMERKIEEIRVMAREAREKERLESKKNGFDSEDDEETDGEKYSKSGIEEEVDDRLIKLRKTLENARKKMPVASVDSSRTDNMRKDRVKKGKMDESETNGALLFQKKYKFKASSADSVEKPKGFIGSDDYRVNKSDESGSWERGDELFERGNGDNEGVGLGDREKQPELSDVDPIRSDAVHVMKEDKMKDISESTKTTKNARRKVTKERGVSNKGKGKSLSKPKVIDGNTQEDNDVRSAIEAVKFRKSNEQSVKSRKSNDPDIAVASNKLLEENDDLKDKGVGDAKLAVESKTETDLWWLNLPYVLVILMRRGDDGEGGEGLYTLKSISSSEDMISHMVAFEDRADATNFCYLLQSFFEDLEDFKADVVPLPIKELNEAVKSHATRVIVLKRGQLRLYAGQPLADAEMALRALIKRG